MTIVLIGPVCEDLIKIGDRESSKVGGASLYQSFVFEEFYKDYLAIVNASNVDLIEEFPNKSKVALILKDDTHYFINEYPNEDNLDIRKQSTNFADIPISRDDLETIFIEGNIDAHHVDAFVLNPLNSNDFPYETIEYLKGFDVPIYVSIQGFLRFKGEDNSIVLQYPEKLDKAISLFDGLFMDEMEYGIVSNHGFDDDLELVITNGSQGSRIFSDGDELRIEAVKCDKVIDATGCGDTYMASYISHRLTNHSIEESANFASFIASEKLKMDGPFKKSK